MKLKYTFEIVEIAGELSAVPVGEGSENLHAVLQVNESAADILRLLENDISEEKLIDEMAEIYDIDRATLTEQVRAFLGELSKADVLQ